MRTVLRAILILPPLLLLGVQSASGQVYPSRPVTLVVPATPGSGPDIVARTVGHQLSQRFGQPVVVDNRAGASGNIGAAIVAKAEPDGHTLMVTINNFVITPAFHKSLPYDPIASFAPISKLAVGHLALVVNTRALSIRTLGELLTTVRARPGDINYGSPGSGSPIHLAMELFKKQLNLNIVHVPYKGMGGFMNDLLSGQIHLSMIPVHTALPHVKGDRLAVLAVSGDTRSVLAPDLPSFGELGLKNLDIQLYYWIAAPAGTPTPVLRILNREVHNVLAEASVRDLLLKQGLVPVSSSPEQISQLIRTDVVRWKEFVDKHGITAD